MVSSDGTSKANRAARLDPGRCGSERRPNGLYLFTQDSIKIVGSTWMRYINSGYFD
jgi:hypothetical protein